MCFDFERVLSGVKGAVIIRIMVSTFCFFTTIMSTVCRRWCGYLFYGVCFLLLYYDKVDGVSMVV